MIYLYKNNTNVLITDSWTSYIPDSFEVYLENTLIGEFVNESDDVRYYQITIPESTINTFEPREYIIKFFSHSALVKQELLIIRDNNSIQIKSVNNSKNIKFYE